VGDTHENAKLGVGVGCDAISIPHAMPADSLCVGAFVGHISQGTTAIVDVLRECVAVRSGRFLAQLPRVTAVYSD
jgi:hypothetical protein